MVKESQQSRRICRPHEARHKLGDISESQFHVVRKHPAFPQPVPLSPGSTRIAFLEHELDEFIDLLAAERDRGLRIQAKLPKGRPRQKRAAQVREEGAAAK